MATAVTSSEHFNNDQFWKSHGSMDTINQFLNGCHPMNIPMNPIGADQPVKYSNISASNSGVGVGISPSLSFSSLMPPLPSPTPQPHNIHNNVISTTHPTTASTHPLPSITIPQPPTNSSSGQASEASTSTPVNLNTTSSNASSSVMSMIPSNMFNFQTNTPVAQTNSTTLSHTVNNSQLVAMNQSRELVKVEKEPTYVDVTPFLILPQHEAARRLGVPCSTLSKRWKEASVNRKWPYRIVCKLDKEITTLLKNVENAANNQSAPLSPAVEENLGLLLKRRQEELRTVVIRIN